MRALQVQQRSQGDDASRVDIIVRHVVVPFDVVEIDRLGHARKLIEILEITGEMRVIDDAPEVAFEMTMVDGIEANERDEETPIGFDNLLAEQIPTVPKAN